MRTDPERVSLDLIGRKLAEVSDEELAALVGAERLLRAAACGLDAKVGPCVGRRGAGGCEEHPGTVCGGPRGGLCTLCCPEHRCGA